MLDISSGSAGCSNGSQNTSSKRNRCSSGSGSGSNGNGGTSIIVGSDSIQQY